MSSVGNARRNARNNPPATRRHALELLAGSRDGCTEAIMLAHGFSVEQITVRRRFLRGPPPLFMRGDCWWNAQSPSPRRSLALARRAVLLGRFRVQPPLAIVGDDLLELR